MPPEETFPFLVSRETLSFNLLRALAWATALNFNLLSRALVTSKRIKIVATDTQISAVWNRINSLGLFRLSEEQIDINFY